MGKRVTEALLALQTEAQGRAVAVHAERLSCGCKQSLSPLYGCGSKIGTQNGSLASGNMDQNLRSPGGLILTHIRIDLSLVFQKGDFEKGDNVRPKDSPSNKEESLDSDLG